MSRIRTIKPEFPQSETVGRLSRDARLLFIQLWTIVDDAGKARAASRMLASLLYPYDDDAPTLIEGWLVELETADCIRRYEIEGSRYLEIVNWLKHQKIDRPSASRLPTFDEASRIVAKPREPSRAFDADLGPVPGPVPGPGPEESSSALRADDAPASEAVDARFDEFWALYPHKVGKIDARKAFAKARKLVELDQLMAGLRAYVAKTDDRPWCNPATWLNDGRWDDQPAVPPQRSGSRPNSTMEAANRIYERTYGSTNTAKAA